MSSKTQSNCLSDPRSGLRAFFGGFRDNSTKSGREQPFGASCRSVAGSFRETRSDLERIVSDTGATGSHPASPARCRSDTKTAPSIGSSRRFALFFRTEQETRGREGGSDRRGDAQCSDYGCFRVPCIGMCQNRATSSIVAFLLVSF